MDMHAFKSSTRTPAASRRASSSRAGRTSAAARSRSAPSVFRHEFDAFRSCVVNEPRGSDVLVGALLCEPHDADCSAGVIFFNNVGVIGMCGHGTIGLAVTLAHLGGSTPGEHRIETPVGVVTATLHDAHRVTVRNVPSYRHAADVSVERRWARPRHRRHRLGRELVLPGEGAPRGVAHRQRRAAHRRDVEDSPGGERATRRSAHGRTGRSHRAVRPADGRRESSRNFVLCPGKAYDRSPCGTGTSAKLACLFADGKLKPGEVWRQESITGSVFEGRVEPTAEPGVVIPSITGTAFITGETTLIVDPEDPLRNGIRC